MRAVLIIIAALSVSACATSREQLDVPLFLIDLAIELSADEAVDDEKSRAD